MTTQSMFQVRLEPAHREKLEAYRARQGLRSEAAAIRSLIDKAARYDAFDIMGQAPTRLARTEMIEINGHAEGVGSTAE